MGADRQSSRPVACVKEGEIRALLIGDKRWDGLTRRNEIMVKEHSFPAPCTVASDPTIRLIGIGITLIILV